MIYIDNDGDISIEHEESLSSYIEEMSQIWFLFHSGEDFRFVITSKDQPVVPLEFLR